MSVHQALMFRQWTDDVTLFLHTAPAADRRRARATRGRGIRIVTAGSRLVIDDDASRG